MAADLQKTVEIVQGSWQKIVMQSAREISLAISFFVGELPKRLRFDARRAPWQAPVAAATRRRPQNNGRAAEGATGTRRAGRGRPTSG